MEKLYLPYIGNKPASVFVKGHRFVVLSKSEEVFDDAEGSKMLGPIDVVKELETGASQKELEATLSKVAQSSGAGVLLVPPNTTINQILERLELELPWVQ